MISEMKTASNLSVSLETVASTLPIGMLLFDAQTSGGLLIAVPADKVDAMLIHAKEIDQPLWVVGEVVKGDEIEVV